MKFPKSGRELEEMFRNAEVPEISEFDGEYFVDMLTILPSLRRFSHRKIFYTDNNKVLGRNQLFSKKSWGRFFLEEGVCEELDSLKTVLINYNVPENSFITYRMRDHVRRIKKSNVYIGRFYCLFMNKLLFLGYFSLTRQ
ncbi:MAG: hypothetical protein WBB86_04220 [Candidatus Omnitrophota bacterium]